MTDLLTANTGEIRPPAGDKTLLLRPITAPTPPPTGDPGLDTTRINPFDRRRPTADATGTRLYRDDLQAPRSVADLDVPPAPAGLPVGPGCRRHDVDGEDIVPATAEQVAQFAAATVSQPAAAVEDLYAPPLQAYAPGAVKPARAKRWPWRRPANTEPEYVGRHRAREQ